MNATRMPGFAAEASFHRSSAYYRPGVRPAGFRQGAQGRIHPALPASAGCYCKRILSGPFCCCTATIGGFSTKTCCTKYGCD